MAIQKTAKKRVRKTTSGNLKKTRRVRTKRASSEDASVSVASADTGNNKARRGRPVSIEGLKNRLEKLQESLQKERLRRRKQLGDARVKISTLTVEKRVLKQSLREVNSRLGEIEAERKKALRDAERQQRLEEARNLAVAQFLMKWDEKQRQSKIKHKRKGKRGPGRPRKS